MRLTFFSATDDRVLFDHTQDDMPVPRVGDRVEYCPSNYSIRTGNLVRLYAVRSVTHGYNFKDSEFGVWIVVEDITEELVRQSTARDALAAAP
jgi:hypothetical protein